jgi:pimeloyl-[acyl-carrier protein] methyl ester esterase
MSLHVKQLGSGAPLLLIHGWGMHGGLWGRVVEQLAQYFRVLPGHGYSLLPSPAGGRGDRGEGRVTPLSLDAIVDELSAQFDVPLNICGWSLGGQIALHWAKRHPQQVQRLVLVASTPCFVRKIEWPCAMPAETLAEFGAALQQNYALALRRFLALQVRGSEQERELLATLRGALFSHGEPELGALQGGLEILRDCDLRSALPDIKQPALVVAGERDMLTPPQASQYLANHLPDARLVTIRGAAHAPFLSHSGEFMEHILNFLYKPGKINW